MNVMNNNMNNNMNINMNNNMNNNINNNMNNMNNNKMNVMNSNMNNNMNNNMKNNMNNNMNVNLMNNMNNNINNNMMKNPNFIINNSVNKNMNNLINVNNVNNMNNNIHLMNNFNKNNNINKNFNNNNINFGNNYNNNQKIYLKKSTPLSMYKKPTLIGLQNIGATCFMNATIQCLSQTEELTNYFLDEKRSLNKIKNNNIAKENPNKLQLTPVYLQLVKELWNKNSNQKYYEPRTFMKTVEEMNPLFKLGQAGDSKDFIIFILEQFHNELKKIDNSENEGIINQYDRMNTFQFFLKDFAKQTSVISDIFYGVLETTNICLNCKNNYSMQGKPYPICYNYQIFNCLIFPLEEVRKMKNENNMRNNIFMGGQNNVVTLDECFWYNQKTDLFTGENRNHCNICNQLWDSHYTSRIYSSPNVLVLILNRGKNNKYNVKLNFGETLDIRQFVQVSNGNERFNLYGVITHYGESGPYAHFMAFCKSPIDNKWYRYNDAVVTKVNNVQNDIIDFGNPYILFYKK